MFFTSNPADSTWPTTQPSEHEASAPGKIYLFMKIPLSDCKHYERQDGVIWKHIPDEILVLPVRTDTSDLEDEHAIVVEKVVDLPEEGLVPANSNMLEITWSVRPKRIDAYIHLSHLETNDFVEGTFLRGDFSVVHAKDTSTVGITTVDPDPLVTKLGLILAESNTGDFAVVVLVSESGKGTPSTSNIEEAIIRLEIEFLADDGQFVVLELLKAFFLLDIQNNTGGIDHAMTKEPFVEVITS